MEPDPFLLLISAISLGMLDDPMDILKRTMGTLHRTEERTSILCDLFASEN